MPTPIRYQFPTQRHPPQEPAIAALRLLVEKTPLCRAALREQYFKWAVQAADACVKAARLMRPYLAQGQRERVWLWLAAGQSRERELDLSNPADVVLSTPEGSWLHFNSLQVTLAPHETPKVSFTVNVPAGAPPGEKENWVLVKLPGLQATKVLVTTFVGTEEQREAGWEIHSNESGISAGKKIYRGDPGRTPVA